MQIAPDLVQEIQSLFLDELSIRIGPVDVDTDLVQRGILDSVAIVRLAAALDKRFRVRVPIEELVLDAPCSVARIARLTAECMRENGAANGKLSPDELEQLTGQVEAVLAEKLSIRVESDTTDLFETGALDSMTLVQLVLALEERFGIELPIQEIEAESMATLAKIAETVAARRKSGDAPGDATAGF
jgi:D-alanine--poly(phosphoribitol) ligase subunit 2